MQSDEERRIHVLGRVFRLLQAPALYSPCRKTEETLDKEFIEQKGK